MIKKPLKYFCLMVFSYVFLGLITPFNKTLRKRSIENQIYYLDQIMSKGYDNILQRRFPEGKLFSNALFSLSVLEFCEAYNIETKEYANIVEKNIDRILSEEALEIFNPSMVPKYGVFYNGWTLYVLNKYRKSPLFQYSRNSQRIITETDLIEHRLVDLQKDSIHIGILIGQLIT